MNYLLFGGTQAVGKSSAIYRLAVWLNTKKHFKIVAGGIPNKFEDFLVVLFGKDRKGVEITILINAATDTEELIDILTQFMDDHKFEYRAVISSVRDRSYHLREYFFKTLEISKNDLIAEIPLAKINKHGANYDDRFNWYEEQVDELARYILSTEPFNI